MVKYLLLAVLLLPAFPASAGNQITRDQTWRLCSSDDDCVIAQSMCPGTWWAIHKKYLWKNAHINERLRTTITCLKTESKKPESAYCHGGICLPR